jgi:hypothetical protein
VFFGICLLTHNYPSLLGLECDPGLVVMMKMRNVFYREQISIIMLLFEENTENTLIIFWRYWYSSYDHIVLYNHGCQMLWYRQVQILDNPLPCSYEASPRNHDLVEDLHICETIECGLLILGGWDYTLTLGYFWLVVSSMFYFP